MKEKRGDKTKLYAVEYLIFYVIGSILFVLSYLYDFESLFLTSLAIMVVSLYLTYISSHLKRKEFKIVKAKKTKKAKKKAKKIKKHLKFKFPKFKFSKFKIPSTNLDKNKKKSEIKPHKGKQLRVVLKHSGKVTETDFDRLINFVNQVGTIKVSNVARIFNISLKQAEEWGRILEEHNLLQLHYPPIGEPELRKWKK